jgi:hypothetical protein
MTLASERFRHSVSLLCFGLLLWQPRAVAAEEESDGPAMTAAQLDPETRVLAREFAIRGAEAFDAGDFPAALEHFNRASAILDVPSIAVMQARTLVKLGRWIEGLDRFQQTARLQLPPNAPVPYKEAVVRAAAEADALRAQIPQLTLELSPGAALERKGVEVHFDDKVVARALLNISRPVNPGTHEVRAASNGVVYFKRVLEIAPNERVQVLIPSAPKEQHTTSALNPSPGPVKSETPTVVLRDEDLGERNWPLYGTLGLTGLGLAGTITTAVLASSHKAKLDDVCTPSGECPREYEGDISALKTERTLFYVSTGLTVLAGGVAAYLWFSDQDEPGGVALRLSPSSAMLVGHY